MARKRANLPKSKVKAIFNKYGGKCAYCGTDMKWSAFEHDSFTLDHIIPRKEGGTYASDNLLPACLRCNNMKGDTSIEEFRELLSQFTGEEAHFYMDGPVLRKTKKIIWGFERVLGKNS